MSLFEVKYRKKDKPKGTRSFNIRAAGYTFEEVLFNCSLSRLCYSTYQIEYDWFMLNNHVFYVRSRANAKLCIYQIKLYDMRNRSKLLVEYEVEIDCMDNDGSVDLCEQDVDHVSEEPKKIAPKREMTTTEWFRKETRAVKNFLLMLHYAGNLKELKKEMPKATYFRNLKVCEARGYIQANKLVKRIFINRVVQNKKASPKRGTLVMKF